MSQTVTIALDAMGGDLGPDMVIPGAAIALRKVKNIRFAFFGDQERLQPILQRYPELLPVSQIHHTDKFIRSDEKPATALRQGKESSMRLAINAVSDGNADCIISAGNTGALMATAKLVFRTLEGIQRPAIASVLPSMRGQSVMLDLGANIRCDAETLAQFGVLGSVYARVVMDVSNPTVGVLNVGSEEMKGNDQVRDAAKILSDAEFPGHFYGFVEGDDIAMGTVDVVVTDGFTGNIALKTAEGTGRLVGKFIKDAFRSSIFAKLGYLLASNAFRRLRKRVDPRRYNGGIFLGLNGICIKSHGGSDAYAFSHAIRVAAKMVQNDFNKKVGYEIQQLASQESFISRELEAYSK